MLKDIMLEDINREPISQREVMDIIHALRERAAELERKLNYLESPWPEDDNEQQGCDHERRYFENRTDGDGHDYDHCVYCGEDDAKAKCISAEARVRALEAIISKMVVLSAPHDGEISHLIQDAERHQSNTWDKQRKRDEALKRVQELEAEEKAAALDYLRFLRSIAEYPSAE